MSIQPPRHGLPRFDITKMLTADRWRDQADLFDALRRRERVSKDALVARLRKLERDGVVERRGRGKPEWRLVPSPNADDARA